MRRRGLFLGLGAGALPILSVRAWSKDGAGNTTGNDHLAVIVNKENPNLLLSPSQISAIFTAEMRDWPGDGTILAFNYPPETRLRILFDKIVLGMTPDEVGKFWLDQRIRGSIRPPRQIPEAGLVLRLVAKMTGAIGYVPTAIVDDTVRLVARIEGGKLLTS